MNISSRLSKENLESGIYLIHLDQSTRSTRSMIPGCWIEIDTEQGAEPGRLALIDGVARIARDDDVGYLVLRRAAERSLLE